MVCWDITRPPLEIYLGDFMVRQMYAVFQQVPSQRGDAEERIVAFTPDYPAYLRRGALEEQCTKGLGFGEKLLCKTKRGVIGGVPKLSWEYRIFVGI